jgi:hypothetical protein
MKIRRRGRHATPSQVEKVAAQAGKAAPAMAIAGALVAVPAAQPAPAAITRAPAEAAIGAPPAALDSYSAHAARASVYRMYTVRPGDSLASIARHFYHKPADWQWLAHVNAKAISNPDMIYVGQRISVPLDPPAHYTLTGHQPTTGYQPRHARPASGSISRAGHSHARSPGRGSSAATDSAGSSSRSGRSYRAPRGSSYSCADLEKLWDAAGGRTSVAVTAAEIAMAESGGNPNALSPTSDYGLWQINASNGTLATFNPYENARSAILLSGNGRNWGAWTTYTSGAYHGQC